MPPGAVVPADVLDDRPPDSGLGWPGLEVGQLAFDGGEEGFGGGVDAPISVKLRADLVLGRVQLN